MTKKEESGETCTGIGGTILVFPERVRMRFLNSRKMYPHEYFMQLNYLSVHKIRRFHKILRINPNYFPLQNQPVGLCNGEKHIALGAGIMFLNSVRWLNS